MTQHLIVKLLKYLKIYFSLEIYFNSTVDSSSLTLVALKFLSLKSGKKCLKKR